MSSQREKQLTDLSNLIKKFFEVEDLKCKVIILKEDIINASVQYLNNEYIVKIYSGLINNVHHLIEANFKKFDCNDRKWFSDFQYLDFLKELDYLTPETEEEEIIFDLKHLFTSSIFFIIIYHELSHVLSNHIDKHEMFNEFTFNDEVASSDDKEAFRVQEMEMVADWFSVKRFFSFVFLLLEQKKNIEDIESYNILLRKTVIFIWLVLVLEFQITDFSMKNHDIDLLKTKRHPPNEVRFYYCTEALQEIVTDTINEKFGITDEQSESLVKDIFSEAWLLADSFLGLMGMSMIDFYNKKEIYTYYIELRNFPYQNKDYDNIIHLQELEDEQIEVLDLVIQNIESGKDF